MFFLLPSWALDGMWFCPHIFSLFSIRLENGQSNKIKENLNEKLKKKCVTTLAKAPLFSIKEGVPSMSHGFSRF